MKKILVCFLMVAMCIIMSACGAESKYKKYISEHTPTFDDYVVPTEFNSDKETYLAIIDLGVWAATKYDIISKSYGYKALSTYVHDNNLPGEYYEKFEEVEDALLIKLQNQFALHLETILDNSSDELRNRKDTIVSYYDIANINAIESIEEYRKSTQYRDMFSLVVFDGGSINENFNAELFYSIYPTEVLKGCQEYIEFTKNVYKEYGNEQLAKAKSFLESVGKISDYVNDIAASSEYLNNKIVCYASGCPKTATIEIIGFSGQKEYYCSDCYQEMLDIMNSILGN